MRIAVVGAGIVGLAVAYEALLRDHDVTCYDAADPMTARSTGDTRVFRYAHWTPEHVRWAERARSGWDDWERAAGRTLVGREGAVVSGRAVDEVAAAMSAAGVPFTVTDEAPALPADHPDGPFLTDPNGGVIRAAVAGGFLLEHVSVVPQRIERLDELAADAVVVAAGAGTPALAAQAGVDVPGAYVHHARFTYRLRDPDAELPCWLETAETWRPGFTSYGQPVGGGRWALGGELPDEDVRWDLGLDEVVRRSRETVTQYVRDQLPGLVPEVLDTVTCNFTPGLGDGVRTARAGRVQVVWGDNLFKMAPEIGRTLVAAVEA